MAASVFCTPEVSYQTKWNNQVKIKSSRDQFYLILSLLKLYNKQVSFSFAQTELTEAVEAKYFQTSEDR